MALDVAGRRHRHVHAGEIVVSLLGIAGVVMNLGADVLRQMAELIAGGTAGVGIAPATGFGSMAGIEYGKVHGSSSEW